MYCSPHTAGLSPCRARCWHLGSQYVSVELKRVLLPWSLRPYPRAQTITDDFPLIAVVNQTGGDCGHLQHRRGCLPTLPGCTASLLLTQSRVWCDVLQHTLAVVHSCRSSKPHACHSGAKFSLKLWSKFGWFPLSL